MMGLIHIGTSGFSYDDWLGTFYPPTILPDQRLAYYAQQFNTVELNASFYKLPALPALHGMLSQVPEGFRFFVKAHRDLTHVRTNARDTLPRFHDMLKIYQGAHKLAGVLIQFPPEFDYSAHHEDYLRRLLDRFHGIRAAVEFRHTKWMNARAMALLRELGAAYCLVDMPPVRDLPSCRPEVTAAFVYLRFHGQNREHWARTSNRDERYDYDYSDEELRGWAPVIASLSTQVKDTYVYFNNHYQGNGAKNAKTLDRLLASFRQGSDVQRLPIS